MRGFFLVAGAAILVVVSGCAGKAWEYQCGSKVLQVNVPIVVGVCSFEEAREANKEKGLGKDLLGIVPLVPFDDTVNEKPDAKDLNHPQRGLRIVLSKSLASELESTKAFDSVIHMDSPDSTQCDLLVKGRLIRTQESKRRYCYGVSWLSPIIWSVGAPSYSVAYRLNYEVIIEDREGNELFRSIYGTSIQPEVKSLFVGEIAGHFYLRHLAQMARGINRQVVEDIEVLLAERPTESWDMASKFRKVDTNRY